MADVALGNYFENQRLSDYIEKRAEAAGDQALGNYYENTELGGDQARGNYYERLAAHNEKPGKSADQLIGNYCVASVRNNPEADQALGNYC